MRTLLAAVVVALLVGCPKPMPTPPFPDASDAALSSDCASACTALVTAGCALGDSGASCAAFLQTMQDAGQTPNPATQRPITCGDIAAVRTRADAQRLGFVCP